MIKRAISTGIDFFMLGMADKANKKLINLFLILAKKAIWKRRNIAKNRFYCKPMVVF